MNVSKININSQSKFNGALLLKSKDARFINLLEDVDFHIFNRSDKNGARFYINAGFADRDGYWSGKLLTGKDIKTPYATKDADLPAKVISSLKDVLKIPAFKEISAEVTDMYSKMFL